MKHDLIICPKCEAEYLPCEIFIPNIFFGNNYKIDKDSTGKIVNKENYKLNTEESYICDYCNTPFKVKTNIRFSIIIDEKHNFNEDYIMQINKKPKIFLDES